MPARGHRGLAGTLLVLSLLTLPFVAGGCGGTGPAPTPTAATLPTSIDVIPPTGLSAEQLKTLAARFHQPVYWAGPVKGDIYEVRRVASGGVYIRYLPPGVKVGDPRGDFLIVATYPYPNSLSRLEQVPSPGGVHLPGGAYALPDPNYPKSVHVAFPVVPYQAEVYDPSPAVAQRIAFSGMVRPVATGRT
jgi:hypothetical protein